MQPSDLTILEQMFTNRGERLDELTFRSPVMLVFLRHFGCVFCKQALGELSKKRQQFEEQGLQLVFVHMADEATAKEYFEKFQLPDAVFVCDQSQRFYRAFGLMRGSFTQLYGLQTWIRGYQAKREHGYELELAQRLGDSTQMPGVFVLHRGEVRDSYIHQRASDRPDYQVLAQCCAL